MPKEITMSDFSEIQQALYTFTQKLMDSPLYVTDVDKDYLWNLYLDSFPAGTNEIFRERREYDCNCCKQFIRTFGHVVILVDDLPVSIWDSPIFGKFVPVFEAMSEYVKSKPIKDLFFHYTKQIGTKKSLDLTDSSVVSWSHFYTEIPKKFVKKKDSIASLLGEHRDNKNLLKRSLETISLESAETVLELIEQNSLYRGEEHKEVVKLFIKEKKKFLLLDTTDSEDNYCWSRSQELGFSSRIRNTVIGTLLVDLSEGKPLDLAVNSFETKVAPANYKRSSALITQGMIESAQKKVQELGVEDSLARRCAKAEDLTINNVLFADRSTKPLMSGSVFDDLKPSSGAKPKNLSKVEEVSVETFIKDILPKAQSIEALVENRHTSNLMSLVAPVHQDAKGMFKWGNNFSWAYNGDVTDSMKSRVKAAGGKVDGVLRFSIQWNDGDNNQNDLDAHCIEPNNNRIYFSKKRSPYSSGQLDVDIQNPGDNIAVENITWSSKGTILEGEHIFLVDNYSHNGGTTGFTAELEYEGKIWSYTYNKALRQGEKVQVAKINFSQAKGIEFLEALPSSTATKEIWGIQTETFQKVSMVMNSPNHWDGEQTGNKHWFFMLEGCKNEDSVRGFFNEYLSNELTPHRKVFEVLGSKMKAEPTEDQLSGIGFSSTQRNSVVLKISGSFNRVIKVLF